MKISMENSISKKDFETANGLVAGDEADVEVFGTFVRAVTAKLYGPMENCYPAEGGYCEDVSVKIGKNDITKLLTDDALDRLSEELYLSRCGE